MVLCEKSLTALMYSVPDKVNALATKMVTFKARLLCKKSSVCTQHMYYNRKVLGCLPQALPNKDSSQTEDLMTLAI